MNILILIVVSVLVIGLAWKIRASKKARTEVGVPAKALSVLALFVILFVFALSATDPGDNLVVVESAFATTSTGSQVVTGIVENRTDRAYSEVTVQVDLLNAAGDVVGRTSAAISSISGGDSWKFEAPVTTGGAVDFRTSVASPENVRPEWLGG